MIDHKAYARERSRTDLPALEKAVYKMTWSMRDRLPIPAGDWKLATDHAVELMFDDAEIAERVNQRRAEIRAFFQPRGKREEHYFRKLCETRIRNEMRAEASAIVVQIYTAERYRWLQERARMFVDTEQEDCSDIGRANAIDWAFDELMAADVAALREAGHG